MTALSFIPKRVRLAIYATAILGLLILVGIGQGYRSVDAVRPDWLVALTAAWSYVAAGVTPLLALGNLHLTDQPLEGRAVRRAAAEHQARGGR